MNSCSDVIESDIIIIGAGISGMSAAYYMLQCEPTLDILILEAERGRTLSVPLKTAQNTFRSFDLGGQFLTNDQPFIQSLVKSLNIDLEDEVREENNENIIWDLDPDCSNCLQSSLSEFSNTTPWQHVLVFVDRIDHLCRNVQFSAPYASVEHHQFDLITIEEYITSYVPIPVSQNLIRNIIQTSCGLETSQMSLLFYLAYCNATGGMKNQLMLNRSAFTWIKGGADQICSKIATLVGRQYIKTNRTVLNITWDSCHVMIETNDEIYCSQYAIVAIPPAAILKINFTPAITEKHLNVLKSVNSGHLLKFVVTYKKAFWRDHGYAGTILSCGETSTMESRIHWCFDTTVRNCPALTGYLVYFESRKSYKSEVLLQLAKYFGDFALNPIDYYEKNWVKEEHSSCFTTSPKLGDMKYFPTLKQPLGRLFWAGTETANCWNGNMEGAVQAGYRAASEVLYYFRPQTVLLHEIQTINRSNSLYSTVVDFLLDWKTLTAMAVVAMFTLKK
ncbi:hypothetical protein FQA39_LY00153 [Lamprigera yunnana]|nr:hypothetical protein FQA39_LY00153 [Lamprigera yunnana]